MPNLSPPYLQDTALLACRRSMYESSVHLSYEHSSRTVTLNMTIDLSSTTYCHREWPVKKNKHPGRKL